MASQLHSLKRLISSEKEVDWEAAYAEQLPLVYNYFRYRVGDGPEAEDLTATTFEKAWKHRRRYRRDLAAFSTWLFTIARNIATDHFRQRRETSSLEAVAGLTGDGSPEATVQRRGEMARLADLLRGLPERERELVALKYGVGLTNRVIAQQTGLSETNVGTILSRVVQAARPMGDGSMNDDFLTRFRKPPRREFAAALYERISKPMNTQSRYVALRRTVLVFPVLAAVVLTILFISPPARSFAASVLRLIGVFTIVDDSSSLHIDSTAAPTALPPSNEAVQKARDASEARELAGFTVYAPAYLPGGYAVDGWSVMAQGNGMVVVSVYRNSADSFLNINQYQYGEGDHWERQAGSHEDVIDVIVRGQAGAWITGTTFKDSGNNFRSTAWLMWEEDGVNYSMFSDALLLDDMLKIAESLTE